eukprot:NODE_4056_length_869_cov_66.718293_g3742_i0.p1 GENE.NODE_4056_length_869_cov_66.718293_g3742_i0~~NODE_4056_length_869_cov_66.718293_g3742_i0.p1  ORF type:complete len:152 (+),score=17.99 NODE_4056_length_869_cov_66.718293_g3742_i0:322-777(+)
MATVQHPNSSWTSAVARYLNDLHRVASEHCRALWCSGPIADLRCAHENEVDRKRLPLTRPCFTFSSCLSPILQVMDLMRDFVGTLFGAFFDRRQQEAIYDALLCHPADFIPYMAVGLLKAVCGSRQVGTLQSVEDLKVGSYPTKRCSHQRR